MDDFDKLIEESDLEELKEIRDNLQEKAEKQLQGGTTA